MMPEPIKRSLFWILLVSFLFLPGIPASAQPEPEEELITMNFEDADIRILIKFISELVQKNFIIDEKIKGKVTVISPEKITVAEAYRVFESILEVKGFTLVPAGKVTKIVPKGEAKTRGIETGTGKSLLPSERGDEFITRIIRLEYVNVDELLNLVRPLFSKDGNIQSYKATNTLIMTELKSNLYRILKIINELDVKGYHAELYVIPLHYASVKTVSDHLNKILEQGAVTGARQPVRRTARTPATTGRASVAGVSAAAKIISDERTNSLIVLATRNDYETITNLVQKLDVEAPEGRGRVNIYYLQNAVAEEIVSVLNEFISGIKTLEKTEGGVKGTVRLPTETDVKIVADKSTNALIISADPEDYEQIRDVLEKLDIPRSQVLIEALFMEVRGTDTLSVGVEWVAFGGTVGTDNSIDRLGFGGSLTGGGALPAIIGDINDRTLPSPGSLGGGFSLGVFGNFIDIDGLEFPSIGALIRAVATRSDTNILATPQILTMDNEEAEIIIGENRPFVTQARSDQGVNDVFQSFDYQDVGLTLKVTPHISQNRTVRLEIFQEISRVDELATEATGATAPVTTKRSADTAVVVGDGRTIVIAGLIEDDVNATARKVPCLGDLPWLGYLFKSSTNTTGKTNLMIFITPHIVTNPVEAAQLSEKRFEDYMEFKVYETRDPDIDFYGQQLKKQRLKQLKRQAPYLPIEEPLNIEELKIEDHQDSDPAIPSPEVDPPDQDDDKDMEKDPQSKINLNGPSEKTAVKGNGEALEGSGSGTAVPIPETTHVQSSAIPPPQEPAEQKSEENQKNGPSKMEASQSAEMTTDRYLVRTGVYVNPDNLNRQIELYKKQGLNPYTLTKTVTKNQYDLHLGPLENLSDFDRITASAKTEELNVWKYNKGGNLYALVNSSREQEVLKTFADQWESRGIPSIMKNRTIQKEIYWIIMGEYATREEAEKTKRSLMELNIDSLIITTRSSGETGKG